ncbi:peptidoglycan glycosyltransferase [Synergistales bacterium]|nr:peptidoglycan glycosyltransferase [Synergistales bacterium]
MESRRGPWVVFVFVFVFLAWKLVEYHCFPDPRVYAQAQRQYWSLTPIMGNRGYIQDSRGNTLALSVSASSFFVDPEHWSPSSASSLIGLIPENIIQKISGPLEGRYVRILRRSTPELAQKIIDLKLDGLYEEKEKKREYPHNTLLAHVLGYCDFDENGQSGVELAWNSTLYEPPGHRILIRQTGGRSIAIGDDGDYEKEPEISNLTLTIDIRIQYIIEKYLDEAMKLHKAKWGAVLCMDPKTGAVLSMASWPTFDPNNREGLSYPDRVLNNAIGRAYEPGSTFKPIFMGIAIEDGLVRTNETFQCPARLKVADGVITEAYKKGMGTLSTPEILIKSSNVGMAQIGIRSKPLDMYRSLLNWGFGKIGDIELKGVEKGLILSPGQWRGVVPANISIGQGLAVTPLQLIAAMAPVVNGGEYVSPYIVQEARNSSGEIVYQGRKNTIRELLTPETCSWLRKAMRDTVTSGTGRQANTPLTELAAKTGTAQVAEKGKYVAERYVSSIVGFWPYENPQYLALIVIGEPSDGKYYGGEVAGPVLKKIVEGMADLEAFDDGKRL